MNRPEDIRDRAIAELSRFGVLMLDGHFDYGNGYHGRTYLNPHQLFRYPSTIWRLAQDLLDVVPSELSTSTEVVAGPVTGGALLAHTIAGLLDSRRTLTHPPCSFAPFGMDGEDRPRLRSFYRRARERPPGAARRRCAEYGADAAALRRSSSVKPAERYWERW